MAAWEFEATIEKVAGKVLVRTPESPATLWGERDRYHVRGSFNEFTWRGPIVPHNGGWAMSLGAAFLEGNTLAPGQQVRVRMELEGPQTDGLPEDFLAALEAEPEAKAFFESLATFYRKGYLKWLEGAKKPEKRVPRIAEIIALLKSHQKSRP